MDKMWAGGQEGLVKGPGGVNAAGELIERSASAADQQARLQAAIESEEAEEAYVQVGCGGLGALGRLENLSCIGGRCPCLDL